MSHRHILSSIRELRQAFSTETKRPVALLVETSPSGITPL